MKNIVYTINTIVKGGPSSIVLGLIRNIDKKKYNPILITLFKGNDDEIVKQLKCDGIRVIECNHESRLKYLIRGHIEFKRIIESLSVTVIHSHGFVPDIVSAQIRTNVKRISTIHNVMFEDYAFTYGKLKSKVYSAVHLLALKRMDTCVCCAESVHNVMKKYLGNTSCIRNGTKRIIDKGIASRSKFSIPQNAKVFIYVGCLTARKRTKELMDLFNKNRNDQEYLLLIGDGPEKEKHQYIQNDHVRLLGFQKNPYQYMNISDVYISASAAEGFSVSIIEALDCGLGVFLSSIPSHEELFMIDENVYLGELFNEQNFDQKLSELRNHYMDIDRERIRSFKDRYLSDLVMTQQYERMY